MIKLKKLAGLLKEDETTGLMSKVNKVTDPQTKNMLSDIAVTISDIKGFVMDMEEIVYAAGLKKPSDLPNFRQEATYADSAIDDLVRKLEAYITRVHG